MTLTVLPENIPGIPHLRIRVRAIATVLALCCTMAPLVPATAQVVPRTGPFSPVTPGDVFKTMPAPRPVPPPTPAEMVFPAPRPGMQHDPAEPRFAVYAFRFEGNSAFPQRTLQQLLERYIDMRLNLYELTRVADIVTRYYRDNGYPIARAIVPAQKVEKGVVRIEVIEGRLGKITVVGNKHYSEKAILARLAPIPRDTPITTAPLERGMLLLNDLPGLSARATLEPGAEFDTTNMLVRVQEDRLDGLLSFDNHGLKEIGQWRADGSLTLNNPLGIGDQLLLHMIQAQDNLLTFARAGYSVPLTASGARLAAAYSNVDYKIAGDFSVLGIAGMVTNAEINVTYPYLRSRRSTLLFAAGVRRTTTDQTALSIPITHTEINLASASVAGTWVHEDSSVTNAFAAFTSNGKSNPTRTRQDAEWGKLEFDVNHLRAASAHWDLFLRGNLVLSHDALSDTEKFSLGGPDSVRAYRPSELRGDSGIQGTVELRRQFTFLNRIGVFDVFYDQGAAKAKGFGGVDTIRGAGLGSVYFINKNIRAKLEYAYPLSDRVSQDGNRGRAWFTLTGTF